VSYDDLRQRANMRALLQDLSRERFFARTRQNFGFSLDLDRALEAIAEPTYAGALRAIFEQFAHSKGMVRWGDKTPEYNSHLDTLLQLFPDAQFLHVVRDPRAVAVSQFRAGFGSKNAYEAAVNWHQDFVNVQRFGARMPAARYHWFRYEDLVADPAAALDRVACFLGIANHTELTSGLRDHLRVQVRAAGGDAWRKELSREELRCIEAVCGGQMAALGYDMISGREALAMPGPLRLLAWHARSLWRRAADGRYWADNLYRLRLRLREVPIVRRTIAAGR
jgi:hypothetical protein